MSTQRQPSFSAIVEQKQQRVLDLVKCMRLSMQDAEEANDLAVRQAYWHTAQAWGRKVDAAFVDLELAKQTRWQHGESLTSNPQQP